jgi:hypothetical protein
MKINEKFLTACLDGKKKLFDRLRKFNKDLDEIFPECMTNSKNIIAINPKENLLWQLKKSLYSKFPNYNIMTYSDFSEALPALNHYEPDIVVLSCDITNAPIDEIVKFLKDTVKIIIIDSCDSQELSINMQNISSKFSPGEIEVAFG